MRLIDADALLEKAPELKEYLDVLAPTIEPQKWIPCSERLPKKFRRVLCTIQDGEQLYVSPGAFIRHTDAPGNPDFRVVAWMPLPEEPYKEGKE